MKHKYNKSFIYEGKLYKPVDGVIDIPVRIKKLNPIEEEIDAKAELVKEAHSLGLGSPSTLKRLSEETLKEKIEEAK